MKLSDMLFANAMMGEGGGGGGGSSDFEEIVILDESSSIIGIDASYNELLSIINGGKYPVVQVTAEEASYMGDSYTSGLYCISTLSNLGAEGYQALFYPIGATNNGLGFDGLYFSNNDADAPLMAF